MGSQSCVMLFEHPGKCTEGTTVEAVVVDGDVCVT